MSRRAGVAVRIALGAALVFAGARPAQAAAKCTIDAVTGVAFGAYDVDSPAPLDTAQFPVTRAFIFLPGLNLTTLRSGIRTT